MSGRGATPADIDRRLATQGDDLAGRLEQMLAGRSVLIKRLATNGSLDETRDLVEDTLAEALDRPITNP
jgi:hypothetical protein